MLKAYLYCCYQAYSRTEYTKMLSGNPLFLSMGSVLKEELKETHAQMDRDIPDEMLEERKGNHYDNRQISKPALRALCE